MISPDLVEVSEVDCVSDNEGVEDGDSDEDSLSVFEEESEADSESECVDVELAVFDTDNEVVLERDELEV